MESFNPHSPQALFATILERLDDIKRAADTNRSEMQAGFKLIDTRVSELEREKWYQRGAAAAISAAVVLAWHLLTAPTHVK